MVHQLAGAQYRLNNDIRNDYSSIGWYLLRQRLLMGGRGLISLEGFKQAFDNAEAGWIICQPGFHFLAMLAE